MSSVAVIGGGKMAEALVKGMLSSGFTKPSDIVVSDVSAQRLQQLQQELGVQTCLNNFQAMRDKSLIILAVKPQVLAQVLAELHATIEPEQTVVSIVAGATIAQIAGTKSIKIARVMPNTPALVGQGASAVTFNSQCSATDKAAVLSLLGSIGVVVEVPEEQINAVTGLSGSGPAFVFKLMQAFIEAGQSLGLTAQVARQLTLQTFSGAAQLAQHSTEPLAQLADNVTSPNGTTAAGRAVLEASTALETIKQTIATAKQRADELSAGEN